MASLYEIEESLKRFIDVLYASMEDDGCIPDDVATQLEELTYERDVKRENIALYIKQLEADAKAIKAEESNLTARRKAKENKAEWLKKYLTDSMSASGETSFETARCKLSFRKSEQVEILDEDLIPDSFVTIVTDRKPNKAEIKKAINAGEDVAGAFLVTKNNIQIK